MPLAFTNGPCIGSARRFAANPTECVGQAWPEEKNSSHCRNGFAVPLVGMDSGPKGTKRAPHDGCDDVTHGCVRGAIFHRFRPLDSECNYHPMLPPYGLHFCGLGWVGFCHLLICLFCVSINCSRTDSMPYEEYRELQQQLLQSAHAAGARQRQQQAQGSRASPTAKKKRSRSRSKKSDTGKRDGGKNKNKPKRKSKPRAKTSKNQ